ncbi:hypothetical protein [Nocardia sp. NPDC127526]|uniref:hypothetical protein n=1 Tax=Nocardia sp. NPDC127526 TaxID=3345393 RepID=UPI003639BBD9
MCINSLQRVYLAAHDKTDSSAETGESSSAQALDDSPVVTGLVTAVGSQPEYAA